MHINILKQRCHVHCSEMPCSFLSSGTFLRTSFFFLLLPRAMIIHFRFGYQIPSSLHTTV